jgi:hypothetical protein
VVAFSLKYCKASKLNETSTAYERWVKTDYQGPD